MKRIILLFIILSVFIAIMYTDTTENFTPHIRGLYRPHMRSVNRITEHYTNKFGLQMNNLLRKYNIF